MCGFCGYIGKNKNSDEIIKKMMSRIIHRGPDSEGVFLDEKCTLGFRRLSIIGLEDGNQPIFNEDETLVLVFNGEIYNYKAIKEDLISKGHVFNTHADSEVLIHSYEEFGTDMLNKLRGMFSFVIWDKKSSKLFGARDYFGIKPFYYSLNSESLIFGSEIKSILEHPDYKKELNHDALENYLTFQYSGLEETFFKNILRLPPAHFFVFENGKVDINRYWEPVFETEDLSIDECVDKIDKIMHDSIEAHKVSDVEVGCFLSSGVDSSYVASCFNGDKTFTVGFDYDKYNEIDYAKTLSKSINIDNYHKYISKEEYWDVLPKVQYQMDEPLADPAAVALYFVSELASKHVKVVLSGEGADELFGGYNIYKEPLDIKCITCLPMLIRRLMGKLASMIPFRVKGKNFFIRASKTVEERFIGNAYMFSVKDRRKILKVNTKAPKPQELTKPFYKKVAHLNDSTKMQYIDLHFWLAGDILLKADKMSMAHSLELRVPFLDKEVCSVAMKIPEKYRVNKLNTKYAMRLAAKRNMPENVANKKKLGFPVPIRIWLREKAYYEKIRLSFTQSGGAKYFVEEKIVKLLDEHYLGKADNSRKIWTIYMFLVWYDCYFEN